MTLKMKITAIMGLMLLVCAGIGGFSLFKIIGFGDAVETMVHDSLPATIAVQRMNTLTSDFRIAEMQHVLSTTAEDMRRHEKRMEEILAEYDEQRTIYKSHADTPKEKELLERIVNAGQKYIALHKTMIALSHDMRTEEARILLEQKSGPIFDDLSNSLLEIVALNVGNSDHAGRLMEQDVLTSRYLIAGGLAFSIIVSIVLASILLRDTMRQLGKDPAELNALSRRVVNGDYDIDDGSARRGVYAAILEMVAALKKNIEAARHESEVAQEQTRRAQQAVREAEEARNAAESARRDGMLEAAQKIEGVIAALVSSSNELAAQIEQSDKGSTEAAQRLDETATAMTQMNSSVQDIASNTDNASSAARLTRDKAVSGARVVDRTVHSIGDIHERSLCIKADMEQLNQHAQAISRIMDVISDIADQTNLLALNAAIEAARAGEAGRGFAVVADEVRKLAEKTMDSTSEVGSAIRAIQESVSKSLAGVDKAVDIIQQATEQASESGKVLHEIVETVEDVAEQVSTIATASEEQSAASEEINQHVVEVSEIVQQNAQAMTEAAQAVNSLAEQTQDIARIVQEMKSV